MSTSISIKVNPKLAKFSVRATVVFFVYYALGGIPTNGHVGIGVVALIGILFGLLQFPCMFGALLLGAYLGSELFMLIGVLLGPGLAIWLLSLFTPVKALDTDHALLFGVVCIVLEFVLASIIKIGPKSETATKETPKDSTK